MLQTSRDTQHSKSTLAGKQRIGLSLRPSSRRDILQIRLRGDRETRTRPLDSRSSRKIRARRIPKKMAEIPAPLPYHRVALDALALTRGPLRYPLNFF